jgi:VCBS repeat-containing protein
MSRTSKHGDAAPSDGRRRGRRAGALAGAAVAVALVALALPAGAHAQLSFSPTHFAADWSPNSVAVGDFNDDDVHDLAVANGGSDDVSVLLGAGDGRFGMPTNFDVGGPIFTANGPVSVAVGDFNGDSEPDLAVANIFTNDVSVLLGEEEVDEDVSFAAPTSFSVGDKPSSVAVGHFNEEDDSHPDLAVANSGSDTVSVLLGNGSGGFAEATNSPVGVGDEPLSVAVGDFNADTHDDLAVANAAPSADGTVSVLIGDGKGGFASAKDSPVGALPKSVAVGDFDGDSDADLAVANLGWNSVTVLIGDGKGGFATAPNSPFPVGSGPNSVAVGDFDGDSNPDLAVANGFVGGYSVSVLLGDGGGGFAAAPSSPFAVGVSPQSVAVGDFNDDTHDDLAVANFGAGPPFDRGNVAVLINNHAPVAAADSYVADEDMLLSRDAPGVLGNDTDPEGDDLRAKPVSDPDHGSLELNDDGSFNYTPEAEYHGSDSFSYRAKDGQLESEPVTVTIEVRAVNDAPQAADNAYTVPEDTVLAVDLPGVLGNDSDPEGDDLHAELVSDPDHGSLELNADGSFNYTPEAEYHGNDSFSYRAKDGHLESEPVTVRIEVTAVNDAPAAHGDEYATDEETPLTVAGPGVLGNDTDAEGDTLTAKLESGPGHGGLSLNADGSFTYTPQADYDGPDSFTYRAHDGSVDSEPVTVTIAVNGVNDAPGADADSYATDEDTPLNVAPAEGVLGNDTDPDEGDALTAKLETGPDHGGLSLNGDGSFSYTPQADYHGPDSFTYRVHDGSVDSEPVTVTISVDGVNDAPGAGADSYVTDEDTPLNVDVAEGVLGNDTDREGDALTAVLEDGPGRGSLSLNTDGSLNYTPEPDYNGRVSFTYRANDGDLASDPARVTVDVRAVDDTPPAGLSFSGPTDFAGGDSPSSVALGDFDGDSDDDLAVANEFSEDVSALLGGAGGSFGAAAHFAAGSSPVSVAVADFDGDSDLDLAVANFFSHDVSVLLGEANGSFAPATSFPTGAFPTSVAVGDFNGDSDPDLAVANAVPDNVSVLLGGQDGTFVAAGNVDVGDDPWSVAVGDFNGDSDPDLAVANRLSDDVSVLLGGDGASFGAPTSLHTGTTPVSVAVGDFDGNSDPDLAVANRDSDDVSVLLGAAGGDFSTTTNFAAGDRPRSVAVGDFDGDFDPDLAVANQNSDDVSVLLGAAGGTFATAAAFAAGDGPSSVAVGDFNRDSDPDLVVANQGSDNVSVLLNNHPPDAAADTYATDEDTPLSVDDPGVLENDSDPDQGDGLTAELVSGPQHGNLTLNSDGSLSYTPDPDYNGSDSFSYRASDGNPGFRTSNPASDTATVTINVTATYDPPPADPPPADPAQRPPADASSTPPAGMAPPAGSAAPAQPALAQLRLDSRCARRSRSGRVRIPMTLRMARPRPVQVRIDRRIGTKASRSCPNSNQARRVKGRYRKIATLRRLATRPVAAGRRRLTLKLRLGPGLYRITVRAHLDSNRLSRPHRRYLNVLGSPRSGGS